MARPSPCCARPVFLWEWNQHQRTFSFLLKNGIIKNNFVRPQQQHQLGRRHHHHHHSIIHKKSVHSIAPKKYNNKESALGKSIIRFQKFRVFFVVCSHHRRRNPSQSLPSKKKKKPNKKSHLIIVLVGWEICRSLLALILLVDRELTKENSVTAVLWWWSKREQ